METNQKRKLSIFLLLAAMLVGFSTKAAGEPEKMITVMVHVTKCDHPAAGAKVTVIDAGWDDNLASGTTNAAGDCSIKAPAGYNIVVQATYKGEVQKTSYFATDENYRKQIVYLKFDDECNGNQTPPERLAAEFTRPDDDKIYCVSYDNYGKRYRIESRSKDDGCWGIMIMDHLTCHVHGGASCGNKDWTSMPMESALCNPDQADIRRLYAKGDGIYFYFGPSAIGLSFSDKSMDNDPTLTKGTDETINGYQCSVYTSKLPGGTKIYKLKGQKILIRLIMGGKIIYDALKVTTDVPADAFTPTSKEHYWLK